MGNKTAACSYVQGDGRGLRGWQPTDKVGCHINDAYDAEEKQSE